MVRQFAATHDSNCSGGPLAGRRRCCSLVVERAFCAVASGAPVAVPPSQRCDENRTASVLKPLGSIIDPGTTTGQPSVQEASSVCQAGLRRTAACRALPGLLRMCTMHMHACTHACMHACVHAAVRHSPGNAVHHHLSSVGVLSDCFTLVRGTTLKTSCPSRWCHGSTACIMQTPRRVTSTPVIDPVIPAREISPTIPTPRFVFQQQRVHPGTYFELRSCTTSAVPRLTPAAADGLRGAVLKQHAMVVWGWCSLQNSRPA